MRLTFLGTGSAMPTGERFQTGLLLESADSKLLVDCGSGALHGLASTQTGYEGVDTLLLTHHHLDHVADLMPLLKARWLAGEESLTIVGPEGTRELVEGLLDVHEYMQDRLDLTFREIGPTSRENPHEIAGFDVAAMETRHSMYCLAYRFESPSEAGPITFSGDSEAFDDLLTFADGSAIVVHDCSFPDEVDVSNHPTPTTLGQSLAGVDVETLVCSHLYPHTTGREDEMAASVRAAGFDGTVRFATDGLTMSM